jgi:hypothetical protein
LTFVASCKSELRDQPEDMKAEFKPNLPQYKDSFTKALGAMPTFLGKKDFFAFDTTNTQQIPIQEAVSSVLSQLKAEKGRISARDIGVACVDYEEADDLAKAMLLHPEVKKMMEKPLTTKQEFDKNW